MDVRVQGAPTGLFWLAPLSLIPRGIRDLPFSALMSEQYRFLGEYQIATNGRMQHRLTPYILALTASHARAAFDVV